MPPSQYELCPFQYWIDDIFLDLNFGSLGSHPQPLNENSNLRPQSGPTRPILGNLGASVTTKASAPNQQNATTTDYAERISVAWQKTIESILETAQILAEARTNLPPAEWHKLINGKLPFKRRMAEKLAKIAEDARLADPKYRKFLPVHWTTLHDLTYVDDKRFQLAIKNGSIHPAMERKDVAALRAIVKKLKKPSFLTKPVAPASALTPPAWDSSPTVFGSAAGLLALIELSSEVDENALDEIEHNLRRLKAAYGVTLRIQRFSDESGAIKAKRSLAANELREWHHDIANTYRANHKLNADEMRQYDDAIFQLENKRHFEKIGDEYQLNDLRHTDNPFHNWFEADPDWALESLYDTCRDKQVLTCYTPLQFIDYPAFLRMLALRHCLATPEAQLQIEVELADLDELENKIALGTAWLAQLEQQGIKPTDEELSQRIPFYSSNFRSPDICTFTNLEPGMAKATLEGLVR